MAQYSKAVVLTYIFLYFGTQNATTISIQEAVNFWGKNETRNIYQHVKLHPILYHPGKYPVDRLDPEKYERFKNHTTETRPTLPASVGLNLSTSSSSNVSPTANKNRTVSENGSPIGNMSSASFNSSEVNSPSSHANQHVQPSPGSSATVTFESLLLGKIKRTDAPQKARRKIDSHSHVITSEDYLRKIQEKEALISRKGKKTKGIPTKNVQSTNKKRPAKRPTRIIVEDSDGTTTPDEEIGSSGDDGEDVVSEEVEPAPLTSPNNVVCGDFLLVKFPGGKRNATTYRYACIVQEVNDCEVTVMSMISQDDNKLVFKMKDNDISTIEKTAIIGKLPIPKLVSTGDRVKYVFANPVNVFQAS